MRAGRVVQQGSPVDVWRAPADGFVARFLGFGNVFDVDVRDHHVNTPWGSLTTDRPDGPATLVLRPDALRIADSGVAGTVGPASFRGDHFLVSVDVDGWKVEVTERSGAVPVPGEFVRIALKSDAALIVP
jgi:thiamine transport system ATP-binding protein